MKKKDNKKQRTLEEANVTLREKLAMVKATLVSLLKILEDNKT